MIVIKLNVSKIPKARIFEGKKGKYLDLRLVDKPDEFGNAGFVVIDLPREARDGGEKGEIVGNWKTLGGGNTSSGQQRQAPQRQSRPPVDDDQDVPF